MAEHADEWYDEAAGPLVRPYAMTGGRTRPANLQLDVATQVMVARANIDLGGLGPEHLTILELSRRPRSVAEIASYVYIPLVVAKVMVSDLIDRGDVVIRPPMRADAPDRDLLQAVLDGIHAL